MGRITVRGKGGKVYLTGCADVCWGGRPVGERAFCTECHGDKDNRGVDRSKCGPLTAIDHLAAYEDTGMEPEEIQRMKEYMEPFTIQDIDRFNEIMRAEKDGRLVVLPVKPGTKVYGIGYNFGNYELVERYYNLAYYRPEEFLIATFKTREEAEAALKKIEEADNEAD